MNCSMELFHIRTLDDKKSTDKKENKKISTVVNHVTLLIPIILLGFNDTDTYFGWTYITKTVNLENNLKWTDGGDPFLYFTAHFLNLSLSSNFNLFELYSSI